VMENIRDTHQQVGTEKGRGKVHNERKGRENA
jgi:hypothetical protein